MTVTLANAGAKDRPDTDFYPTPPDVTRGLLDYLKLDLTQTNIWEPACGQNHMVSVMQEYGFQVDASDLYTTGKDFLTSGLLDTDWIITNPPFIRSEEFIRHARALHPAGGFAFLLKSQYWHATKRLPLFQEIRPTEVLPLTWRPDFLFGAKKSAPTMEVLWTIWRAPYTNKTTIYEPMKRPK